MEKSMKSKSKLDTRTITLVGLLTAVIIILSETSLGFIQIGPIAATTVHIPVLIGAIAEGPIVGGLLGFMFGMLSFIQSYTRPMPTSFLFMNPLISVVPRVIMGLLVGYVFKILRSKEGVKKVSITLSAAFGSIFNTISVLGLIYIIYAQRYIETLQSMGKVDAGQSAGKFIAFVGLTNGVPEMIVAALISTPICYALLKRKR